MYTNQDNYRITNWLEIRKLPWECSKLKRLRKGKNQRWKDFEHLPTDINLKYAIDSQKAFESTEADLKRKYEKKLARGIKTNSLAFFSYIRSKRKVNKAVGPLTNQGSNSKTKNPKESADLLADYFSSVFTMEPDGPLRKECYVATPDMSHIDDIHIDDQDVYQLLISMDIFKSHGPDEIHSKILKLLSGNPTFVGAVSKLFRSCVKYEKVPEIWKYAIVIPLFKKGCRSDASNYRPVSLTCVLCKVYEKFLRKHILQHVKTKCRLFNMVLFTESLV